MLTFSSICASFVSSEGFEKKECGSDAEAKEYASSMDYDSKTYPVVYFMSDTTGEKAYEEFYVSRESYTCSASNHLVYWSRQFVTQ